MVVTTEFMALQYIMVQVDWDCDHALYEIISG